MTALNRTYRQTHAPTGIIVGQASQRSRLDKLREMAWDWVAAAPGQRTWHADHVGGPLPVRVRFVELCVVVGQHHGKNEEDSLAQAGMLILNGGFEAPGKFEPVKPVRSWLDGRS